MNALIDLTKCREYLTVNIDDKDHQIRLSGTIDDPYFCGKDVCKILGYKDPKNVLYKFVDKDEKKNLKELRFLKTGNPNLLGKTNLNITHNEGQVPFISESGLYNLIMHSNAPFAKEFQKLVCKTILPNIRKYGSYQVESQLSQAMEQLAIKDNEIEEAEERVREATREQQTLQSQLVQEQDARLKAEQESEEHKQYALTLKDLAISSQKRPLNERIYISTSKAYASQNRFKVGGVESVEKLKPRFSGYNGRSSVDDMWYYSDLFKVANFKAAEKHIEDVLGRFRERKNKEIYVLHYSDLRRYVEWICENYEVEIEKFNQELDVLISNLNKYKLRPVIPSPYQGTSATITRIVDDIPSNTTIEDSIEDQFKHKIKVYLDTLEPTIKEVTKNDLFSQVDMNFNKVEAWKWLKEILPTYKPNLKLNYR
jgi:prophage antirepressor-like protein